MVRSLSLFLLILLSGVTSSETARQVADRQERLSGALEARAIGYEPADGLPDTFMIFCGRRHASAIGTVFAQVAKDLEGAGRTSAQGARARIDEVETWLSGCTRRAGMPPVHTVVTTAAGERLPPGVWVEGVMLEAESLRSARQEHAQAVVRERRVAMLLVTGISGLLLSLATGGADEVPAVDLGPDPEFARGAPRLVWVEPHRGADGAMVPGRWVGVNDSACLATVRGCRPATP